MNLFSSVIQFFLCTDCDWTSDDCRYCCNVLPLTGCWY